MSTLRFGIIGAGAISQAYAQALNGDFEHGSVVGVADPRADAATALAERLGAGHFPDHVAMVDAVDPDAVIVCTPPSTHEAIATYCLERGIAVLCEKPLSLDSASAARMYEVADRKGVLLMMASKFRYVGDMVKACSLLRSGTIGQPVLFENTFTGVVDMTQRWNSKPAVSGGGVLADNGTHSVDVMRYLLGPVHAVQAVDGPRLQGLEVDETVQFFARTADHVVGRIDLSWSIHKPLPTFVTVYGTEGVLHVGWRKSEYKRNGSDDWIVFGDGYDKVQAFRSQLVNFAQTIRGEARPLISKEDALASVAVIEAAYASIKADRWTRVEAE